MSQTWMSAWQAARVVEGTSVGALVGRLLLPTLWRDARAVMFSGRGLRRGLRRAKRAEERTGG